MVVVVFFFKRKAVGGMIWWLEFRRGLFRSRRSFLDQMVVHSMPAHSRHAGEGTGIECTTIWSRNDRRDNHKRPRAGSITRSEERRVGKEWRSRWSPYH